MILWCSTYSPPEKPVSCAGAPGVGPLAAGPAVDVAGGTWSIQLLQGIFPCRPVLLHQSSQAAGWMSAGFIAAGTSPALSGPVAAGGPPRSVAEAPPGASGPGVCSIHPGRNRARIQSGI